MLCPTCKTKVLCMFPSALWLIDSESSAVCSGILAGKIIMESIKVNRIYQDLPVYDSKRIWHICHHSSIDRSYDACVSRALKKYCIALTKWYDCSYNSLILSLSFFTLQKPWTVHITIQLFLLVWHFHCHVCCTLYY